MLHGVFFQRLFLPYLALICLAIAGIGAFSAVRLRSTYLEGRRQGLRNELHLVTGLVQDNLNNLRLQQLAQQIKTLGQELACRITVIRNDGAVLADNWADPSTMENHANRPEILRAAHAAEASETRYSDTVHSDMLYLAKAITLPSGRHFLRLAVSAAELRSQLRLLYTGIAGAAVVTMAIAGLILYLFARRSSEPIVEITGVAQAIAKGQLNRRSMTDEAGEIGELAKALNTMADAIGQLLAQAEHGRAELLTILASMSEGVIATDTQQHIRLVNEAAGKLLGFAVETATGKPLWQVVRNDTLIKAATDVLGGVESRIVEIGPIGGRHVEVRLSQYRSKGEPEAEGLVVVVYDTTHLVRYQELRKEFVANVSHELRTPLSVVRGFAETLADGAIRDPEKAPQYLGAILRHTEQLTNLVNDLLALSRLESQPELPRRTRVDLGAAARKTVELLTPAAQKKGQTLTLDIMAGLPAITGDPDYLERGIANLIDNAIKYTGEGGKIDVAVAAQKESLVVEVRDNGIGIPPPDLERVFERFYRVDRSRSREMGGTGLGLAIVKHVAQVHGGTVEVQSEVGKGSVFRIKIPGRWA